MDKIPVSFEHKGKTYSGRLTKVMGAGSSSVYHLEIEGFLNGRVRYVESLDKWFFDPSGKVDFSEQLDYFTRAVIASMG